MQSKNREFNRRCEPRYSQNGEKVEWRQMQRPSAAGELRDISESGASFVTKIEGANVPHQGEIIELRSASRKSARLYEVVRAYRTRDAKWTIACHWNEAAERVILADQTPKPSLSTFVMTDFIAPTAIKVLV